MKKNNRLLLTIKYTLFMSLVLVASLFIIYILSNRARQEAFQGTLRSEAITKANLFLEQKVDASTMQHIYLNNTQFINEVEVAVYTKDFQMLYHDAAEHDIVKESLDMIKAICQQGEMDLPVEKGYQAVGILYRGNLVVTAAAHDGYGEANMATLRSTLITIFLIATILMIIVGYIFATLTIRPIERALISQKMFASNVSHELRTPLAAIMGELGLALQKERSSSDYQERIQRALDDASHMSSTIIGLLNMARAEYDASQIKMVSIRIDELLMDVVEKLLRAKPDYHINISFDDTPETDDSLNFVGNSYLLSLAFRNLIENNCKYSHDHTSHVSIHTRGGLSLVFADNGVGMTTEDRRHLFQMFYRGKDTLEGGHGIGMALVQRIILLHNTTIEIISKKGHGTKFIVNLD